MERVTTILHISLALLVITAAAIFAAAEARTGLPAVTIPVAVAALLLVDQYGVWRMSLRLQGLLGLLAFVAALVELWLSDIEAPLLAGGHLLTYLTTVFLLQPKGRRQVWWLAALSLLQVAVAAVLTYDAWFGLALPWFLLVMLWTLAVFQLQQAAVTAAAAQPQSLRVPFSGPAGEEASRLWLGRSSSVPAVQLDDQHRWVTPRFVLSLLSGTGLSLLLAGLFFVFIPRVWPNTHPMLFEGGRPIGGAPPRTGFTSDISLGHIGEIQESPRIALEARLFALNDRRPLPWSDWLKYFQGQPRFRGMTQEVYSGGAWERWEITEDYRRPFIEMPRIPEGGVLQQVRIDHGGGGGGDGDVVLACGLPYAARILNSRRNVELDPFGWTMLTTGHRRGSDARDYEIEVSPRDPQSPALSGGRSTWFRLPTDELDQYAHAVLGIEIGLQRQLRPWLEQHRSVWAEARGAYDVARRWEDWFIRGDEYAYSLNLSITDGTVDPLIDFLVNTRRGHCEYFASALAVLLRMHGIPTRVVSGYKGGEVQKDGRLIVRDLHAHLWVEAYLFDAPTDALTGQSGPRWITLDPTPAVRDSLVQSQVQASLTLWARLQSGWTDLWSNSVRMTQGDQRALIYDPLQDTALDAWTGLRDWYSANGGRSPRRWFAAPSDWFSWRGGLTAFVLLLALSSLEFARRRLLRWLSGPLRADAQRGTAGIPVPFYRRLEAVLRQHGVRRRPEQTPREFTAAAAEFIAARTPIGLHDVPGQLAESFYAVRFGPGALSEQAVELAEHQVDALERELDADALRRGR